MKLKYYQETDSLYIDLSSEPSAETREISEGVALDYDADGNLVGIDIDNASSKMDLHEITLSSMPSELHTQLPNSVEQQHRGFEKLADFSNPHA